MARALPDPEADVPFRARARDLSADSARSRLAFYHHPVVALSLVLIAASAAQIAVWLVNIRLHAGNAPGLSGPLVHGALYDMVRAWAIAYAGEDRLMTFLFFGSLLCSILSGLAWYAVARVGLGPAWAFWTALLWVVHPGFAFLAQRPGPLALLMLLTPTCLATLIWWQRSKRSWAALVSGVLLGLLALVGLQAFLLLLVTWIAVLAGDRQPSRRLRFAGLITLGFAAIIGSTASFQPGTARESYFRRLRVGVGLAVEGRLVHVPPAVRDWRRAPATALLRTGSRLLRSLYATADGKLERPLFVVQAALLAPALWGGWVAWRYRPWRWVSGVCALFGIAFWVSAGLTEPLARNLVPAGGCVILLGLIGLADLYERLFGRRLTESAGDGKPLHAAERRAII